MVRLYHKLRTLYSFPIRHKKTTIGVLFLFFFLVLASPFFKHLNTISAVLRGMALGEIESLKTKDRRTNFLILGLGGPKNQPSSLTDTQRYMDSQPWCKDKRALLLRQQHRRIGNRPDQECRYRNYRSTSALLRNGFV